MDPPAADLHYAMADARVRLLSQPRQYLLSQKLCRMAQDDLHWLARQETVLGPGSVVMSSDSEEPRIIIRPTVKHPYNETTETVERKLAYVVERTCILKATDILKEVVVTLWPMKGASMCFVSGKPDQYDLNEKDRWLRAVELGYVGEDDDVLVRSFVERKAAEEYVAQYQEEVNAE